MQRLIQIKLRTICNNLPLNRESLPISNPPQMVKAWRTIKTKTLWCRQSMSSGVTRVGLGFLTKIKSSTEQRMQQKRQPLVTRCKNLTVSKSKFKLQLLHRRRSLRATSRCSAMIRMWSPATELASWAWASLCWTRTRVCAIYWASTWTRSPAKSLSRTKLPGKSTDAKRAREQRFLIRSSVCSESRTGSAFT